MLNCYSCHLPQCVNICSLLDKKYLYACTIKNALPTVEGYHTMLKNYKNVDLASCFLLSTTKANQIKENWRNITMALQLN